MDSRIPKRDQGIVELAKSRLEGNEHFRGRSECIDIEEENGTLVLHGRVPSFYLKQVLQEMLMNIEGVKKIDNQVDVTWRN